ncbi:hypothetical protein [Thalassospira alkalitolerans]|uniref:Uncharacterized protein n=1 Tax=Thalassospira alkalitolerans TaxID=1293890 RepID=A0A1Y2LE27_9PROT|nr:hypothetical protein [Thalassospira alkalitolerans]OSQ49170.1 hypothetical protein TALK_06220 [Thalassospira alkalitolerans]|tara:strand:+ start:23368 stop:23658 length:291 start_codon:yes stop_codon:yes gene_type:complete
MTNLDEMIRAAKASFVAIDTAYQAADINDKLIMAETRNKAADQLVALQAKQLIRNASQITDADIAEMKNLKERIDTAAQIQAALLQFVGLVAKFVG